MRLTPPVLWSGPEHDWYTVLEADSAPGTVLTAAFTVKANVARLNVGNNGARQLSVSVNGRRMNLSPLFPDHQGTVSLDISDLVQYGENRLEIRSTARRGAGATFRVEAPAMGARLVHINDIHAKIDRLPAVAAYVTARRAKGGDCYFINAGDVFSGGPVSDLNKGVPMIQALNAMTTELMALGNHDLDHGPANTHARRRESDFPWLSANAQVVDQTATPIRPFAGYLIKENPLGQKIAFIGLTETPPSTMKTNVVGLHFESPTAAAQRLIDQLRDRVNAVVLVSHNGLDYDREMAAAVRGADLIIGAHSHTYLAEPVVVNGVPIVQVGHDAVWIGELLVRQAERFTLQGGADDGACTVSVESLQAEDAAVREIVDHWNSLMSPILDTRIGHSDVPLSSAGRYEGDVALGNIITDAMRAYLGTDIAFFNNGGIRASIPAGEIALKQVYTVLPFGEFIQKVSLTGAQVREVVEYSYSRRNQVDMQVSGFAYTIFTKPGSAELDHVELHAGGAPLDPERPYTVAVVDFIAAGGSGYPFPRMTHPVETGSDVDAVVVAAYIRRLDRLAYPAREGRIRIVPTT